MTEPEGFKTMLARVLGDRMKGDAELCQEIWSALANVRWYHPPTKQEYSVSFRSAGGLISDISGIGDYLTWYCNSAYATVTDELRRVFRKEGWIFDDMGDICDEPNCYVEASSGWWENGERARHTCTKHYGTHVPPSRMRATPLNAATFAAYDGDGKRRPDANFVPPTFDELANEPPAPKSEATAGDVLLVVAIIAIVAALIMWR